MVAPLDRIWGVTKIGAFVLHNGCPMASSLWASPGWRALTAALAFAPLLGSAQVLIVESAPAGARVEVDGVPVGMTPLSHAVESGRRTVVVRRAGFVPWQWNTNAEAGDTTRISVTLDRLLGTLQLDGLPVGAEATVGGQPVDAVTTVPVGLVDVVVRVPGSPRARQQVVVTEGTVTHVAYQPRQFVPAWMTAALAAPGSVQIVEGRPLVGLGVLAGVAGAASAALVADSRMRRARDEHRQLAAEYRSATSEAEVTRLATAMDGQVERARELRTTRRVAVGGALAVYVFGAADALARHALRPGLRASTSELPPVSLRVQSAGLSLSIPL